MKTKTLALFDSDIGYMEKLYHYLEDSNRLEVSVRAFTSLKSIKDYMSNNQIDYLIISDDKEIETGPETLVLKISEECNSKDLYRYNPADVILDNIIKRFNIPISQKRSSDSKTQFIGIYSPVARSMKTSFSIVLGQMLAKKKRVLYLNFESFTGHGFNQDRNGSGNLTDVLYYFNNLKEDFVNKFNSCLSSINGLDYIYPANSFIDIQYIPKEKWEDFLQAIVDMNIYDYVIMDLSEILQGLFDIFLLKCFVVYTMTANDIFAQNKLFQYEEMLKEYKYDEVLQKTKKFTIPKIKNLPEQIDKLWYTDLPDYIRNKTKGEFNW